MWKLKYPALKTTKLALISEFTRTMRSRNGHSHGAQGTIVHCDASDEESGEDSDNEEDTSEASELLPPPNSSPSSVLPKAKKVSPANFSKQMVRDGFYEEVSNLEAVEVGLLDNRKSVSMKGVNINPTLLEFVDHLIAERYPQTECSLWSINYLMYAGTLVVEKIIQHGKRKLNRGGKISASTMQRCEEYIKRHRSTVHRLKAEMERRSNKGPKTKRQEKKERKIRQ